MSGEIFDGGHANSGPPGLRWRFIDYWGTQKAIENSQTPPPPYLWRVNPNDGGSPGVDKNIAISQSTGPNRVALVQEGQSQPPVINFSGVILDQDQYETMERWFDARILIQLTDDLGRNFYGVFSKFTPKRQRRAHAPWYHTYDAEFTATAYVQATGRVVYGRQA